MDSREKLINQELNPERFSHQIDKPKLNNEVSKLGVVVRSFLGQYTNENHENDSTLKLFLDKMQQLEAAWAENEKEFALLQAENEQLQMQLLNERNKCSVFQKRLQFIQENKGHFEKLKEVYSKMKQIELEKCRSKMNIHKATQSDSVMTVSSYATCLLQSEINEKYLSRESSSTVSVRKVELAKAQDTINVLKQLIFRREQTWGLNRDKQKYYTQNVKRLERENASLRSIVRTYYGRSKEHIGTSMEDIISHTSSVNVEVNAVKATEVMSTNTIDNSLTVMQGMVKKLEDRNRELEKLIKEKIADSHSSIFNRKERLVLNQTNDLEYPNDTPTRPRSDILPIPVINEPLHSSIKQPSKISSSPVQRNRNQSLPPPPRQTGSFPISAQYPSHPRCYDSRCHETTNTATGTSRSRRTEKQFRSEKTNVQLSVVMRPGSQEETELEMLRQIKDEIIKKQKNINKKLDLFQHGLDKKQNNFRLRSSASKF